MQRYRCHKNINNNLLEVRMMKGTKYIIISLLCLSLAIFTGCGDSTSSDKTPPTVSIAQPIEGANYVIGNTINVSINADDNKSVNRVEFKANGEIVETLTTSPYSYAWATSGLTPGDYVLIAKAVDKSGNSTDSTPVNIELTRPNVAPERASNPTPDHEAEGVPTLPTLTWESFDEDGDALVYDVYYGTSTSLPSNPISDNQTTTSFAFPDSLELELGTTYYWRIDVYDGFVKTVGERWKFRTTLGENAPPNEPGNQFPADEATGVTPNPRMTWECTDPDGTQLQYDFYFGTEADPPLVNENYIYSEYIPNQLDNGTAYYWRVVASDGYNETSGPIWSFTTNNIPPVPSNPMPAHDAVGIPNNVTLSWDCPDADGNDLVYKVYFGTQEDPPLMSNNQSANTYEAVDLLSATIYYWRIEAFDDYSSVSSPIWEFRTNTQPYPLENPYPADETEYLFLDTVLSWECSDPDGDDLTYEVQMGTSLSMDTIAENLTETTFAPTNLEYAQTYFWRVKAFDGSLWRNGPVWEFSTIDGPNVAPDVPSAPYPEDLAVDVHTTIDFQWICSDANTGQPLTYSLYLGTEATPSLYADGIVDTTYTVEDLDTSTTYYWKVVASDGALETEGPTWSFDTGITAGEWSLHPVANCDVPNGIYGMDYNDGYIYAADNGSGMVVINVNNPSSPYVGGLINTPEFCYDVFYYNDHAYSVDLEWGMQVNNVSNPILPQYVGYANTPGNAEGIWVEGNYAYVADAGNGLQILDLTDQTSPVIVGNLDTDGSAHQVCVVGNYAYVADMDNGIVIVDVSDPANPTVANTTATTAPATDVFPVDDVLYVTTGDGFYSFSMATPSQLSPLGSCTVVGTPVSCYVKDNFAVIAAGDGGITIANVTDTSNPTVLQQTNDDGLTTVKDVRFDNNHIFISNGEDGLVVLRIFD